MLPPFSHRSKELSSTKETARVHGSVAIMPLFFCQLNVYTPLPRSAQAQVVPEQPAVVQSAIATARESIQPFVQASKVWTFTHVVRATHLPAAQTTAETAAPAPRPARLC